MKPEDLVRIALTACVSIIVTGAASWLVFGQDKVARTEVVSMISSALVLPTTTFESRIAASEASVRRLEASVIELIKAQQALVVEQRVLLERVSQLVDRVGK